MYNKAKSIIYFLILVLFFSFIILYYFSNENKEKIFKNRSDISGNIDKQITEIPLLKNDTENIIDYNFSDLQKKEIKKRYFWELLKRDQNE